MSIPNAVNGVSRTPTVLHIGEVVLAHDEWEALATAAKVKQVRDGNRTQFLQDCRDGVFDGIIAISRTWDSTEITGRFDHEMVESLPSSVKFICHTGAGYDSIDAEACASKGWILTVLGSQSPAHLGLGIAVSNTSGAVNASTASTTIFLLLGALRRCYIPCSAIRAGNWRGKMQLTHDPEGKLLGVLGMGGIGSAFAKRAVPFGMRIQYHNRRPVSKEKNTVGAEYVSFDELIRTSDIISIHLPLNPSTRGMIGAREMAIMKPGVVIINTARGPIVDESALVEALDSGKVFAAGLDVYEKEPIVHEGLLRNDKCVLMPHVGTATLETQRKMEALVIDNLKLAIFEGRLTTPVAESREAGLGVAIEAKS